MSNLNVSEPDSVIILTLSGSEKFSYLKIVEVVWMDKQKSQKQKFKVLTTLVKNNYVTKSFCIDQLNLYP